MSNDNEDHKRELLGLAEKIGAVGARSHRMILHTVDGLFVMATVQLGGNVAAADVAMLLALEAATATLREKIAATHDECAVDWSSSVEMARGMGGKFYREAVAREAKRRDFTGRQVKGPTEPV